MSIREGASCNQTRVNPTPGAVRLAKNVRDRIGPRRRFSPQQELQTVKLWAAIEICRGPKPRKSAVKP